jgi:hypothetical protein
MPFPKIKNVVEYGIVGKFFYSVSKKRCGTWNSWQVFFHSFSKKAEWNYFLVLLGLYQGKG